MASQGPNAPTSANDTGAYWVNVTNIELSGASKATYTTSNDPESGTTSYAQGTGFGFSIPTGATIKGITVSITRLISSAANMSASFSNVQLLKSGVASGTGKSGTAWTNTAVAEVLGSNGDLWGTTWTPSNINNVNFGVKADVLYNFSGTIGSRTLSMNAYTITVTYTGNGTSCQAFTFGF